MRYLYSILITCLLLLCTTKIIAQNSPGGVSSTIGAWYKADDPSSSDYMWRDLSGNGNDAPIEGTLPVPKIINNDFNFNRSYQFVGNEESYFRPIDGNEFQLDDYSFFMILSDNSSEVIWSQMKCKSVPTVQEFLVVAKHQNANSFSVRGPSTPSNTAPSFLETTFNSNTSSSTYLTNFSREKIGVTTTSNYYTKLISDVVSSKSFTSGSQIVNNRNNIDRLNYYGNGANAPVVPGGPYIGRRLGCNSSRPFKGNVSEIIMYNSNITGTDKERIESYLAIKYGLTLNHNYIASDGTTITWDTTINTLYNNDIAGIGRDDTSVLQQKQSRSSNTDSFVTFGLGAISLENLTNPYSFPIDKQFLVWGNNDGALISTTATAPLPFTEKLQRNWLVQQTGNAAAVEVMITDTSLIGKFGSFNNLSLVMADDEGYTTNAQIVPLVYNSSDQKWRATVNFNGTKYFSFFTNIPDYMRHGKYFRDDIEKPMGF
jgi:hypothetical protein